MSFGFGFALPHWKVLSGGFTPASLFVGGVQGTWYDPSDFSTLFTDSAGTTPVSGVEQVVGLMLDKSQGLVLGPELVTNGDFDTDTDWTKGAGWTISGGSANKAPGTASNLVSVGSVVAPGRLYETTFTVSNITAGNLTFFAGLGGSRNTRTVSANGNYTQWLYGGTTDAKIYVQGSATFDGSIDNISVRELPGNHATSTGAARPTLSARVNLLTKTEQFDDGVWTKTNATVTANTVVAPDGTLTADALVEDATTNNHVVQLGSLGLASGTYVASMYVRPKDGRNYCLFYIVGFNGGQYFDLTGNGSVLGTQGASPTAPSITPVANGFYRIQFTFTGTATNFQIYTSDNGTRFSGFAGNGSTGLYLWGADLRVANDGVGIPAYQRVNTATDYDTSGFPLYLRFGGTQAMSTGSIDFTATDKMTVWAGVTKLSDAFSIVTELSASVNANNGTFGIWPPGFSGNWAFASKGTTLREPIISLPAPNTSVLTGIGDISGDIATLRANGVASTNTGDQGTGNFGNYPLYIGARNLASFFLNGRLYSLIIRGAQSTAAEISATESWVNQRTGAY